MFTKSSSEKITISENVNLFTNLTLFGRTKSFENIISKNDNIDSIKMLSTKDSYKINKKKSLTPTNWPIIQQKRGKHFKSIFVMKIKDQSDKTVLPLKDKPNSKVRFNEYLEGIVIDNGMDGWMDYPELFKYYRNSDYNCMERCCLYSWLSCLKCFRESEKNEIKDKKEKYYLIQSKSRLTLLNSPLDEFKKANKTDREIITKTESSICVETLEISDTIVNTSKSFK